MSSPSFIQRKTTRITGDAPDQRRDSISSQHSAGKVPHARKPRSRPPSSLRDHLPFPQSTLAPSSGPYSVSSMDIEVPAEHPRPISDITRNGRHVLQLETVLFTLYYPAAFGTGQGPDPSGSKHWSRETWLPRPRRQTARGYARFANIPDWSAIAVFGATSMLTKLRGFRNGSLATHWPPDGNSKRNGYTIKNKHGPPPPGHGPEPVFPLLLFSHGLGGTRTAYSSLCSEFASYGFVVCAVEHRDGSGPRTFVNHCKRNAKDKEDGGDATSDQADAGPGIDAQREREKWKDVEHSEDDIRKGYHHVDYIFPKNNPKDTAPNNERGVDQRLRNAQIELRLCELEEACRVLKLIWAGHGDQVARQNLRGPGFIGGSSRGLQGIRWDLWKHRFHVDKITVAGHSFGAATVVEVLRHTDRFTNVQAGIIYDIWGAPIKPPAEAPEHRIHLPLLGINSEAFMYWQKNFDAVMSLMKEASETGTPAYLLTVRGSVHISQSDFSVLYKGVTNFFMKATVHPQRAIDLNISASLEFLRLVAPDAGAGKSIINRCMTDESLLATDLLDEVPDEHRPTDQWIAARLRVDHEFRTRVAAGVQRRLKRNMYGQKSYRTEDEVWMHFKPSPEQLEEWIKDEGRGEERVGNDNNVEGSESSNARGQNTSKPKEVPLSDVEKKATEESRMNDHVNEQGSGHGSLS